MKIHIQPDNSHPDTKDAHYPDLEQQRELRWDRNSPRVEFEKNYPKNIFIPIIEYLADAGWKTHYEACVGTRQKFQDKNVVSLNTIYQLISQPWFVSQINKDHLLANVCNKILMNSKIKKKIFHLKMAQIILSSSTCSSHQFRTHISKSANQTASSAVSQQLNDDLIKYSNACIYLLHLFLQTIIGHISTKSLIRLYYEQIKRDKKEAPIICPQIIQEQYRNYCRAESLASRDKGSKDQYKFLSKELINIFSKKYIHFEKIDEAYLHCQEIIHQRADQIRLKFKLLPDTLNWNYFLECIVQKCFSKKLHDLKVTNSIFSQWISEFKTKSTSISPNYIRQSNVWSNFNLDNVSVNMEQEKQRTYGARPFTPIILSQIETMKDQKSEQLSNSPQDC